MSTPATPTNVFSSQGNQAVYLSWDLSVGATSYVVQRSTDQITYATIASPTTPEYLDTAVTLGTAYYYKVAAVTSAATYATATINFTGQPSNAQKFVLNNLNFVVGTNFALGATVAQTIANAATAVNNTASFRYIVSASASPTVLTFTSAVAGVAGNLIELEDDLSNTNSTQVFSNGVDPSMSDYSSVISAVPAMSGEMSLGEIRLRSQQKADLVGSNFITKTEWNWNINQSLFELYDLLIDTYEDQYLSAPYTFPTNGTTQSYPLPDGVLTFTNNFTGVVEKAPPFYKMWGVDLAANTSPQGWCTMRKFNPLDRNKYYYPNSQSTIYGVFNAQYRVMGNNIEFIPIPSGNQTIRIRYIPRLTMLLADNNLTSSGVSGWLEYVVVDAAIKALNKEESDVSSLVAAKLMLKQRIEAGAKNRDVGWPQTIQDTRSGGVGGLGFGSGGQGGFGGAGY